MTSASPDPLARILTSYVDASGNPDMRNYYAAMLPELQAGTDGRLGWTMRYLARLGNLTPQSRVLDIGCGFGIESIGLAIVSGSTIVANDIRETMTRPLAEGIARLRAAGTDVKVETLLGDICAADLPASSFDAIVCNQTIEHVHDLSAMFAVCHHVLKPGGRLVITNDNNALNPDRYRESTAYWRRRDRDVGFIEELKRDRPIENADAEPYAVMREAMIREANPSLTGAQVTALADATAGLTEADVRRAAGRPDAPPTPPELSWCRNPATGEYCERLLDPFAVSGELRRANLRPKVLHGFRKFPLNALNAIGIPAVNRALFRLRAYFLIVATKPS